MRKAASGPGFVDIYLPNLGAAKTAHLVNISPLAVPSKPKVLLCEAPSANPRRPRRGGKAGGRERPLAESASAPLLGNHVLRERRRGGKDYHHGAADTPGGASESLPSIASPCWSSPAASVALAAKANVRGRGLPALPDIGAHMVGDEPGAAADVGHDPGGLGCNKDAQAGLWSRRRARLASSQQGPAAAKIERAAAAAAAAAPRRAARLRGSPHGGRSPGARPGMQLPPPVEERSPLEAISAISRSVAGNLDSVIKRCGEFATKDASPTSSRAMQRLLYEASFGDPVYLKARRMAESEAAIAAERSPQNTLDEDEASSFKAIADVTRRVQEELNRLQGESWASNVLLTANARPRLSDTAGERCAPSTPSRVHYAADLEEDAAPPRSAASARSLSRAGTAAAAVERAPQVGGRLAPPKAGPDPPGSASSAVSYRSEFAAPQSSASSETTAVGEAPAQRKPSETPTAGDGAMSAKPSAGVMPTISLGGKSVTGGDFNRLQAAFKRFKVPDSGDIHKVDLYELLRFLGHVMVDEAGIEPLIQEVTPYEYLDFDEFQSFMDRYIPYERAQFHVVFERFDTDNSGEICVQELRQLLTELNFMPMKGMLQEALTAVDLDSSGSLGFEEFVIFLKTYRQAEGFSTDEVEQLLASFNRFANENEGQRELLKATNLPDALIAVFGLHVKDIVEEMAERLGTGQSLTQSSTSPSRAGKAFEALYFSEFLIFARKVREAVYEKLRLEYPAWAPGGRGEAQGCMAKKQATFDEIDIDKSGGISESELRFALRRLGYTPLRQNVLEVIYEVVDGTWHDGRELDFNEFFAFMLIVRQREGFNKDAVEEMRKVFNRFDEDDSGEVDSLELAELFRHLGYKVVLDEIHVFVTEVDANNSGQLDFREFLKLMRLYRENELKRYAAVFNARKDKSSASADKSEGDHAGRLPRDQVRPALKDLAIPPTRALATMGHVAMPSGGLSFDAFVGVLDACRVELVHTQRKNASFSPERIQHFRDLFKRFDKDGSGDIDTTELSSILRLFRWEPKTPQEQADLMRKLDLARARAKEAGIEDVGEDGSSSICFWSFVQLARLLEIEREKAEEDRVIALTIELNFSQDEVDQFRQIYCDRKRQPSENLGPTPAPEADPDDTSGLNREALRKLMRSLVTTIPPGDKANLERKLNELMVDDQLDFPNFLRFMRWLLDIDFAGLSSRLASRAAAAASAAANRGTARAG